MIRCPVEVETLAKRVRILGGELYATGSYGYWLCGDHHKTPPIPEFIVLAPKHQHREIENIMPGDTKWEYISSVRELTLRGEEHSRTMYPILDNPGSYMVVSVYKAGVGESVSILADGVKGTVTVSTRADHSALEAACRACFPTATKFALLDRCDARLVVKEWIVPSPPKRYIAQIYGLATTGAKFVSHATGATDLRRYAKDALEAKWGMKDIPLEVITVVGDLS